MLEAGNDIIIQVVLSKRLRVEVSRKKSTKHGAVVGIDDMERKTREIVASTLDEEADRELVPQGVAV